MTEEERFEEWRTARYEEWKDKLPENCSEFAFLHLWLKYGFLHGYLVVEMPTKAVKWK